MGNIESCCTCYGERIKVVGTKPEIYQGGDYYLKEDENIDLVLSENKMKEASNYYRVL